MLACKVWANCSTIEEQNRINWKKVLTSEQPEENETHTNSIKLIYEDHAWCLLPGFCKQVPDSSCSPTHKKLHKLGSSC